MISPSEGHYDMLQLQPVGPNMYMKTYIQETGEPPRTAKAQTICANAEHWMEEGQSSEIYWL